MMPKIRLIKRGGALTPSLDQDAEKLAKIKAGAVVEVEYKQPRNAKFHRKLFALLNLGFESFEPNCYHRGQLIEKNFERFRKDVIILAGFYDVTVNINNETRAEAKSISFSSMSEEDFNKLYKSVSNVLLQKVLTNYTSDDLDQVINRILAF